MRLLKERWLLFPVSVLVWALLSGCTAGAVSAAAQASTGQPEITSQLAAATETPRFLPNLTPKPTQEEIIAYIATREALPTVAAPLDWQTWPVLPTVSADMKAVYQLGLNLGNDPHAFSILGDCQSEPGVFLGPYDSDSELVASLPKNLQETARNFAGSFDRYSPAVKSGATTGALLWGEWNENKEKKCNPGETALDCELRVHKPSIVFIHIGTHWETRNYSYLTIIVKKILQHGAVPVVVTKADDREGDERVNQDYATLAEQFGLPFWNFWATVQGLPDGGLEPATDFLGTWKLSEEAQAIHRLSALEALDAVWRGLNSH